MTTGNGGWRPEHEIELVAGTPAGGGQDRPARALVSVLAGLVDVPVKLSNIPGRGGGNAWDYLAQHPGNPHVLAINSPTIITNRQLGVSNFDDTALTPLVNLYTEYIAFLVRADSEITDGSALIARLHDPAALTIAMATALGNTNHMALAQLTRHAGGDPRQLCLHVFDSALHAAADVMAGRAEVAAITAVSASKEMAAGSLRALAVSSPQRLHGLYAQTPTWTEQGINCVIGTWRGVIGARGLTSAQIDGWDQILQAATDSQAWAGELQRHYWINTYTGSEAINGMLDSERLMLSGLLKDLGLFC